ncbi:hypothetical protein GCM10022381_13070 [Leifsonia kafniensis]|uniref:DUF732 domain-containing protein n=1 Tax=Leifsonia kafniensis TaxID=475957 RepID=A0ABP7KCY7_9MICO
MAALAVVAIVITAIVSLTRVNQEQAFLHALRSDPDSRVDGLPDEQLLVSMRLTCDRIGDGYSISDASDAAENNWSTSGALSNLTKAEYLGNVRAVYRAAVAACGT